MDALVSGGYTERTLENAGLWRCNGCGLVWTRKHQAENCEARKHVSSFQDGPYGVTYVLNGIPQGNPHYYTRKAARRDAVPSKPKQLSH